MKDFNITNQTHYEIQTQYKTSPNWGSIITKYGNGHRYLSLKKAKRILNMIREEDNDISFKYRIIKIEVVDYEK